MKLASLKTGHSDGKLLVVSTDLRFVNATGVQIVQEQGAQI